MEWIHQLMMRFVIHSSLSCFTNIVMVQILCNNLAFDLMLIGIIGIEDPLCNSVREAVSKCQKAGIIIKYALVIMCLPLVRFPCNMVFTLNEASLWRGLLQAT